MRLLEIVEISVEEAEAMRLKDIENLNQSECAKKMNTSQSTFQRILYSGRGKTADAIINGKAIRIRKLTATRPL